MSVAPKPGKILEFINAVDRDFQSRQSIDSLVTQILPRLVTAWSSIQLARISRLQTGAAPQLIAATTPGDPLLPLDILEWVLAENAPAHEGPNWALPLTSDLLLEVQLVEDVPEAADWLRLLAEPLAQRLRAFNLQHGYAQLVESLTTEQDFEAMLQAIDQNLLPDNDAILSLVQLAYDLQGQIIHINLLATGWETPFDWDVSVVGRVLRQVVDHRQALVNGSHESMDAALRDYLAAHDVQYLSVWPLVVADQTVGLLIVDQLEGMALNEAQQQAFERVVERLSMVYQARQLLAEGQASRDIADNLVLSSRLITTADSFDDMAQAAIYTIAQQMTGVVMTLFDQPLDTNSQPTSRAVVALGVAEGPADIGEPAQSPLLPAPDEIRNLWRGLPVIINGSPSGGFKLAVDYYDQCVGVHEIGWLAAFGLRAGDQVLGTLEVLRPTAYLLSSEEVDAYTTLADQIGVSVRNRQLLEQTAASLNETRQLYDLNQQLLLAQDTLELLIPLRNLTAKVSRVSHSVPVYNRQGQIEDILINHVITPDQEQVIHSSLRNFQDEAAYQADIAFWEQPDHPIIFVEDTSAESAYVPQAMVDAARKIGVMSYVIMPIYERGRLRDIIRVGFNVPQVFGEQFRRLFQAVRDQMGIVLQSQRLLVDAQTSASSLGKQVVVLQTLTELSTVISIARDENQLLTQSAQALVTALNIDYCQIHMIDPVADVARLEVEYPHQGRVGTIIQPDEMPLTQIPTADRPGPVVVNAIADSDLIRDERRAHLLAQKIEALMMLPLFARGQMIGGIWLHIHREGHIFSSDMIEIAQTIMSQVVVGLQNLRLLAEAQRRSEQLQRVSDLAQTIQANLDLEIVLRTALTESRAIIPIEQMMIALYDNEGGTLRQAARYADGESEVKVINGPALVVTGTPSGDVWDTQQSVHIADAFQEGSTDPQAGSLLVTPLRARGNALGIVSVGHSQPHIYTETDVIVFQQMIGQLAAAIENATVYERTERQARNEAMVNDISSRLQQQVELEDMIKLVVSDLGDALGARRARIRLGTREQEGKSS